MTRDAPRALLPLVLTALLVVTATAHADTRPNVLLLVIDTLRADHLSCYGYARPTSPRLCSLAAGGTRFAVARATSSWTAPSVASILTGLYPVHHGVQLPTSRLAPARPTIAGGMQIGGYATLAYSANPVLVSPRQGFDRGFDRFDILHGGRPKNDADVDLVTVHADSIKVADARTVTDTALEAFATAAPGKPLFVFLHYFDPHAGYYPPAEYARSFGVDPASPLLTKAQRELWKMVADDDDLRTMVSLYDAEIAFTDAEIGRLLDGLPKSRPWLIAVTSDHGEEFMEHGAMSHARTLFDESVRVPLIIAGAGGAPGVVASTPVSLVDVWPTLAELAGVAAPRGVDGRSLARTVRTGVEPEPRTIFADMREHKPEQEMLHAHAAVGGRWKLLQNVGSGFGLYDLAADPGEKRDRHGRERTQAAALEAALAERVPAGAQALAPTVSLSEEDKQRMRDLGYEPD